MLIILNDNIVGWCKYWVVLIVFCNWGGVVKYWVWGGKVYGLWSGGRVWIIFLGILSVKRKEKLGSNFREKESDF